MTAAFVVAIVGVAVVLMLSRRAAVREFLLQREVQLQRHLIGARDWADHFSNSENSTAAEDWRRFEHQARERLTRFRPVKERCEAERVNWKRMVQLLHAEGLYEDRSD